jgi:2-polyprenyl-6-hydroxyphenyl methylase/3-demethylubiquinone-9 3-methyltransferase
MTKSTINEEEVEKFSRIADEWWDKNGKFKPLHKFNPIRIEFVKNKLIDHFNLDGDCETPLKNLKIADVGCGGGLLSEPFASLGAKVTAIDASEKNIKVASLHAKESNLDIKYQNIDVETLSSQKEKFDVVLAMEIIEHVDNVDVFIEHLGKCLNKGGILFIATLNRTLTSYVKAIIGAEYILRWLPTGTHSWKKFLKPSEINDMTQSSNLALIESKGFDYNPLQDVWKLTNNLDVNYVMVFHKS